jgi:RNA polymerase sigma-32 factor
VSGNLVPFEPEAAMTTHAEKNISLERYIRDIGHYPLLTRQQEAELAEKVAREGDGKSAHRLVNSNLRFVVKMAYQYQGYGLKILDLIQEGNMGLMVAVRKFEPERGHRLISYAVWWIKAYMQNYILRTWSLVKLGTTQAQRRLFFKLRSERERMTRLAEPGQKVEAAELAASLRVRPQDIEDMTARLAARDFSLNQPVGLSGERSHQDQISAEPDSYDQEMLVGDAEGRQVVRQQVALAMEKLNEKERYIVHHRLMCEEPETLQCIGTSLSISRERARQIEGNVIRKMRGVLRKRGFGPATPAPSAA